jgi:CheY-like chemotaxis protein
MKKILIVDDEANLLEALSLILELEGFGVATAANGSEALDKLSGNHPDLVLLDVMMPGMDGRAVLERIRSGPTPDTPVILFTGAPDLVLSNSLDQHTMLLIKPVPYNLLLNTIRTALGQ